MAKPVLINYLPQVLHGARNKESKEHRKDSVSNSDIGKSRNTRSGQPKSSPTLNPIQTRRQVLAPDYYSCPGLISWE
jgi:hypothetical protein